MALTCPFGNITSIVDDGSGFGVTPITSPNRDACLRSEENLNMDCSGMLDQQYIKTFFETNCVGKKSCAFEDLMKPNLLGDIDLDLNDGICNDKRAQFFIQYTCEQDVDVQHDTYDQIAKATGVIMFLAFFFILMIYYLQTTSRLDQL